MDTTRWLDDGELILWKRLQAVAEFLPASVDAQLRADSGLTRFEYYVLAMLSEAPDHTRPMSALALVTNGSLSRLSHAATRLEREGWISRARVPSDRRATLATLTAAGLRKLEASAPGHVEEVRRVLFDRLGAEQVRALNAALAPVIDALVPAGALGESCPGSAGAGECPPNG